ncbi:hypothetical protein JOL79_10535 [Microbispora sp. RL4-1S]|uniref:CobW/HypB/UreG nucleotide-binding domain-containing protein n=1 Tax=Microbispora oryzae TaxID=2806554 RepID=A0A941AIU3_9ACTN|nr:GTP-binding protein [Microbispora oryzae]MBP2704247.1 hypothetical protein [Microbispora oryzae]
MITFIPLGGFLGAGKTTTMIAAAAAIEATGRKVSVITNDQGVDLVDTKLARSALGDVSEVTGGCFCCRFEDLAAIVVKLVDDGADTIIAEAVGSCTDLQSTVVRPLEHHYGRALTVAPLTTVVDPFRLRAFTRSAHESDLSYLFKRQLEEADVIALNKVDMIRDADAVRGDLAERYPKAEVVAYSAATGENLTGLVAAWTEKAGNRDHRMRVDYDRYAAAEAELAWLNQEVELTGDGFDPDEWGAAVLRELSRWAAGRQIVIGHAKLTVESGDRMAKLSLTQAGAEPTTDTRVGTPIERARVIVNARVACPPEEMDAALEAAIRTADTAARTRSAAQAATSFQPGYPQPVYRM